MTIEEEFNTTVYEDIGISTVGGTGGTGGTNTDITTDTVGTANSIRIGTQTRIHSDYFDSRIDDCPTPPNSPTFDEKSPILSTLQTTISKDYKDYNQFKFPQSKTFLILLEDELEKIQQKFYSKDGEEQMSFLDLNSIWKRIDYLEKSILILRQQAPEGR